jgi:hypothetical protein
LWIVGLSIVLAAFSYADWLRRMQGETFRDRWRRPAWRVPFHGGLLLVAISVVLMRGSAWWERIAWSALGLFFAWEALRAGRERASAAPEEEHRAKRADQDPHVEGQ